MSEGEGIGPMLQSVIGVILGIGGTIALVLFFSNTFGGFIFGGEKDKFPDFVGEINEKDRGIVLLSLDEDNAVAGFDKEQEDITYKKSVLTEGGGYVNLGWKVIRPDSCVDACICKCMVPYNEICEEAKCETIKDVDRINDFYKKDKDPLTKSEDVEGFYIEGPIKIPLYFSKKDKELIISDKQI